MRSTAARRAVASFVIAGPGRNVSNCFRGRIAHGRRPAGRSGGSMRASGKLRCRARGVRCPKRVTDGSKLSGEPFRHQQGDPVAVIPRGRASPPHWLCWPTRHSARLTALAGARDGETCSSWESLPKAHAGLLSKARVQSRTRHACCQC